MPRVEHRVTCVPYASGQKGLLKEALYDMVDRAKESILLSIFTFRDIEFARRLALAHARGIKVRVVMDASSGSELYGVKTFLEKLKVPVLVYKAHDSINHNKYLIVDSKRTWIGSMNFTRQAYERNRESAIVIFSNQVANFYAKDFENTEQVIKNQISKDRKKKLEFERKFIQERAKHLQAFKLWKCQHTEQK